jgi:hypothetical protein
MGFFEVRVEFSKAALTPASSQRAHLVVHQRNQGRDHHRHALAGTLACNGRYLVAQLLPPPVGISTRRRPLAHMANDVGCGPRNWL